MKIEQGTELCCGECGLYFKTKKSYKDQDQDKDFGICHCCQWENERRAKGLSVPPRYIKPKTFKVWDAKKGTTEEKSNAKIRQLGNG